jgi:photosystem II stability/assembly factor-like uncharacterized protein
MRVAGSTLAASSEEELNSLVQAAKARARSYRPVEYFKLMIYMIVGHLELLPPAHLKRRRTFNKIISLKRAHPQQGGIMSLKYHSGHLSRALLAFFIFIFMSGILFSQVVNETLFRGLKLRTIGPAAMSGRIVDVAVVEKDPRIIYAASATGGLWKTVNNGVTFEPVFEREGTHSIGAIAVHQVATNVVWVGTGERANRQSSSWGDGVYKSIDAGKTWKNMGLKESQHIGRIVLHPRNPDIVYVAAMGHLWGANPERGVFKSADGGQTWERVLFIDDDTGVVDVALDLQDPDILYAAAYQRRRQPFGFHGGGPQSALYKTTDAGRTWKKLTKGLPEGETGRIGISIFQKDPRIVYVCVEQGRRYLASTAYDEPLGGIFRSEDKGETWTFMGKTNPRPMYTSQILVDPNDEKRIYMENVLTVSEDGGRTFKNVPRSTHGDDRFIWINPKDSRHIIKADDGGLGFSYDQGQTWLWVSSLPLSQYYRIGLDMRKPFWVHGGLQDNFNWAGPSATYRGEGILNEDWIKTGGGDGFGTVVPADDPDTVYLESQFLGLVRFSFKTGESRSLRPGNPQGHVGEDRNWTFWGPGLPPPVLGESQAPANWDAPIFISPHDTSTIYAGTNKLWKSTNKGDTWVSLGDLTTGVNRRELKIMGRRAEETVPSLDDGVSFYPTITIIAESPLKPGVLYAGTDDGNLQVSRNGGGTWVNVADRLPGVPKGSWISGIEASRFEEGRVYAVVNNYRYDDFSNYLFASADYGQTWTSIIGNLPAKRVLRTLREDTKNPNLLFVGAELGLYVTLDGGHQWVELKNNMPTVAVNDLAIHLRDNDLVLGTHGRGIWILDNIAALQELTPQVQASAFHLFTIEEAEMIRYGSTRGPVGDMVFRGENPPAGAVIDYYLREVPEEGKMDLSICDSSGAKIADLIPTRSVGINRVVWNLRYPNLPSIPQSSSSNRRSRSSPGAFVIPGSYTAKLTVNGKSEEKAFEVKEDPRSQISKEERAQWTKTLLEIADLYESVMKNNQTVQSIQTQLLELQKSKHRIEKEFETGVKELSRMCGELFRRVGRLHGELMGWTGRPTDDQLSQMKFYIETAKTLEQRKQTLVSTALPKLNSTLPRGKWIKIKESSEVH